MNNYWCEKVTKYFILGVTNITSSNDADKENQSALNILSDTSDIDDPTYSPNKEKELRKRKTVPDYFKVQSLKAVENNEKMPPISSNPMLSLPSTSTASMQHLNNSNCQEEDNANRFSKCPYLDGKFFKVSMFDQSGNKLTAECQLCLPRKTYIKGAPGVSTNFIKHIKKIHPNNFNEYDEYKLAKKKSISQEVQTNAQKRKIESHKESNSKRTRTQTKITDQFSCKGTLDQQIFDKRLLHFLTDSMTAISILEKPSFISLFEGTNLKVMSRATAIRRINDFCKETLLSIQKQIDSAEYVCTTADIWSAKRRSFFGLTCHWIDNNYIRRSAALSCKRLSGSHTYDKIAETLEDIHSKFNIDNRKLVATVTDNGSNFVKAFEEFGVSSIEKESCNDEDSDEEADFTFVDLNDSLEDSDSLNRTNLAKHVRCASHTLNLIATTDVKNAIQKNIALRMRHTNCLSKCAVLWKMAGRPKSAEIIYNVLGHTLSYPGITRWNSFYDAIFKIMKEKEKIPILFEQLGIQNQCFKESEFQYMAEYLAVLKPVATALDILQGENNNFYGYLLPCLGSILKKFEKMEMEELSLSRPILQACKNGILNRFQVFFKLTSPEAVEAVIASFTLPQFKLRWIGNFKNFEDDDLSETIPKLIVDVGHRSYNENDCLDSEVSSKAKTSEEEFFEFDECISGTSSSFNYAKNSSKKRIELEILQYLNDPETQLSALNKYPTIKKLFYRYNTCLPSSAPVERLFSFAEIINAPRRNALSDNNFENLVLLKANSDCKKIN